MQHVTYFNSHCPTCGRPAIVRIEYLGERVRCGHCTAVFTAREDRQRPSAIFDTPPPAEDLSLMRR